MTQPSSVITDLSRVREQREYESWGGEGERKGRPWYRNCKTGCSAYDAHEAGAIDVPALQNACNECPLLPGPGQESRMVEMVWTLPDGVLRMSERPFWYVSAVSFLRVINRAPMGF